jgi:CDP-4-dehydro-6-deoxyglucose reductase
VKARLIRSFEIAPAVRHFEFEVPDERRFDFQPGQFVSLSAIIGGKPITRAYSIASCPDGNRFELCLNLVDDGHFSPLLFGMRPGDMVEIAPPLGYFVWRRPESEAILVATGTGIAPIRAMLRHRFPIRVPAAGNPAKVHLIFGVRYAASLMYRTEFESIATAHDEFLFWPVLSRPDGDWQGRTGHVQEHVMEALGERRDVDVYICGLKAMVDDLRSRLKAAGLDRKHIIYEKYD